MLEILLVRHGESEGNVSGVIQGQQEHPLSPQGHHQAQKLGKFLADYVWAPTHIYTSPLQRTFQTAAYCQPTPKIPIQPRGELLEIHNGVLQGLTWTEAQAQYPQLCQKLENSLTWLPIPGAEAPISVFERAGSFVKWLLSHHRNGDRLWLFSHGGIMQHLIAQFMGCDRVWGLEIPPTGLFEFEVNLDHRDPLEENRYTGHLSKVLRFNQTPHLDGLS